MRFSRAQPGDGAMVDVRPSVVVGLSRNQNVARASGDGMRSEPGDQVGTIRAKVENKRRRIDTFYVETQCRSIAFAGWRGARVRVEAGIQRLEQVVRWRSWRS